MSNEEALRDIILEHIGDERFCDDCPAIEYDNSTGTLDCPYCYDLEDTRCYRNPEWSNIKSWLDAFLDNIRGDWDALAKA